MLAICGSVIDEVAKVNLKMEAGVKPATNALILADTLLAVAPSLFSLWLSLCSIRFYLLLYVVCHKILRICILRNCIVNIIF